MTVMSPICYDALSHPKVLCDKNKHEQYILLLCSGQDIDGGLSCFLNLEIPIMSADKQRAVVETDTLA